MNCEEWYDKLYQILDQDLDASSLQELQVHMKNCRPCWDRFEFEKQLKERLQNSCCIETCTETLRIRIKALFEKY